MVKNFNEFKMNEFFNFNSKNKNKKGEEIFEEIKKDYNENDQSLENVKIYGNLECMDYVIYNYDDKNKTQWSIKKEIKINSVNKNGAMMEIGKDIFNPLYFINHRRKYNFESDWFYISRSLARKIINFFVNEYDKKYPQLKGSDYKNNNQIKSIEAGEKPTLTYVDEFSKNKIECIFPITDLKDVPKYKNWIKKCYAVKGKSKDGHSSIYLYNNINSADNKNKDIDPFGEEDWDDSRENKIKNWMSSVTYSEIEEQIKKDMNIGKSKF